MNLFIEFVELFTILHNGSIDTVAFLSRLPPSEHFSDSLKLDTTFSTVFFVLSCLSELFFFLFSTTTNCAYICIATHGFLLSGGHISRGPNERRSPLVGSHFSARVRVRAHGRWQNGHRQRSAHHLEFVQSTSQSK